MINLPYFFIYGGFLMRNIIKQIKKDFYKALASPLAATITIEYNSPVDSNQSLWDSQLNIKTYVNVKALYDIVSNLNIEKYRYAHIQTGKVIFYISNEYDLSNATNIKILWAGQIYDIDKAIPHQQLGNECLCQMLIQV